MAASAEKLMFVSCVGVIFQTASLLQPLPIYYHNITKHSVVSSLHNPHTAYLETTVGRGASPPSSAHTIAFLSPQITSDDSSDEPDSDGISTVVAQAVGMLMGAGVPNLRLSVSPVSNGPTVPSARGPHKKPCPASPQAYASTSFLFFVFLGKSDASSD